MYLVDRGPDLIVRKQHDVNTGAGSWKTISAEEHHTRTVSSELDEDHVYNIIKVIYFSNLLIFSEIQPSIPDIFYQK